jgi:hypothetical protein
MMRHVHPENEIPNANMNIKYGQGLAQVKIFEFALQSHRYAA